MGKKDKSKLKRTLLEEYRACFNAVKVLDNTNVYAVILSECVSNIFKEGMWQKVLTPYTLILTGGDRTIVGNTMTLNGVTRAIVGILCGRILINSFGADSTFALAGLLGIFGMVVNVFCLFEQNVLAMFVLNFVWAVYNGLWNSCLETEWARSVLKEKREDVNGARQMMNKASTAAGPILSIFLFLYFGNEWTLPLVTTVMLIGTGFTIVPVFLCFFFSRTHEVCQEVELSEVRKLEFVDGAAKSVEYECSLLRKADFDADPGGFIKLTYPLKGTSKYGKLRVLTPDLRETNFMLGKQQRAFFKEVDRSNVCLIHFEDKSRSCVRAAIDSLLIFLGQDGSVRREVSTICFNLWPLLMEEEPRGSILGRSVSRILGRKASAQRVPTGDDLRVALLNDVEEGRKTCGMQSYDPKVYNPRQAPVSNLRLANVIVCCDVLNAVGSGMSLKFIDIFLIEDYKVSPVLLLTLAFIQNLCSVYLTPIAKRSIGKMRQLGYSGSLGVSLIWTVSLFFLGMLCVPGTPFWIVAPSIVMMQSLNSCTKAYNRAKLVNAVPHKRVANYMVWDSLNKANQGGVATFGAMIVYYGGYRACFACTFGLMLIRLVLYTGHTYMEGMRPHRDAATAAAADHAEEEDVAHYDNDIGRDNLGDESDLVSSPSMQSSTDFLLAHDVEEFARRSSIVDSLQPAEDDLTPMDGASLRERGLLFRHYTTPAVLQEE